MGGMRPLAGLALGQAVRLVLLAHVLAQGSALRVAQLAVAVGVVLLEDLRAAGLTLRLDRLALLGVDLAVVVRVVLGQEGRMVLFALRGAAGLPVLVRGRLL